MPVKISITSEHPFPWPDPITFPSPASVRQVDMQPASPGGATSVCGGERSKCCPHGGLCYGGWGGKGLSTPTPPRPVPFHSFPSGLRFTRSLKIKVLKDKSNKLNIYQKKLRNLHINETEIKHQSVTLQEIQTW